MSFLTVGPHRTAEPHDSGKAGNMKDDTVAPVSKASQEESSSAPSSRPLRDVESSVYDSVDGSKYISENYRRAVGASYVLTMGVSGIVLVALASSLRDLAMALDKTSVQVGLYPRICDGSSGKLCCALPTCPTYSANHEEC